MTHLRDIDPQDSAERAEFDAVAAAATTADGYAPFNEQSLFDLNAGRRTPHLLAVSPIEPSTAPGPVVGAAITGLGELDLVIAPRHRRLGHGAAALQELLAEAGGELTAWSHGDHPGARALAGRFGFLAVRTLLELRMPLPALNPDRSQATPDGTPVFTIDTFSPQNDSAEWVALNALVFAAHPEQGAITADDLAARQAENWFAAEDFLIARTADGRMVGYNWLKVDGDIGEIYVLGVHPDTAGAGLGRTLMNAGLTRLAERGATTAALYVEADSVGPVHLYRSLGFTDHTVDVQYHRASPGDQPV